MFKKKEEKPFVSAVIPAAGSSRRMGEDINKLLLLIDGIPVLARTLLSFQNNENIDEIIVVCRESDILGYAELCKSFSISKVSQIVRGGNTRTESVLCGVKACSDKSEFIAIHDAARPLISQDIITNVINDAINYGAAAPLVACKDSIKRVENGFIVGDVKRDSIAAVQTPQIFKSDIIKKALQNAKDNNLSLTDDCAAVEQIGISVYVSKGDYKNIKITTPEDIELAQTLLKEV
ncbi:MAG TPA: 2-C-methyl-D-erythritol 4-phosphate cytidylyltransferase [Candidatus Butyricicoccus avistercoris]|uniref:2-C-methyl-D-erythritol 4-phosphate cytidylyltransferase n=1 Tax=Candidatus Butyricicoccus avistercoris TaxID=2838518 RepID=A0A9D1PH79_9FIRM|nr:2-C-methyl-D-erythritol 4-phosphate cytidylyltransferase [Candidatus Butyricicoccus avistercoris]